MKENKDSTLTFKGFNATRVFKFIPINWYHVPMPSNVLFYKIGKTKTEWKLIPFLGCFLRKKKNVINIVICKEGKKYTRKMEFTYLS